MKTSDLSRSASKNSRPFLWLAALLSLGVCGWSTGRLRAETTSYSGAAVITPAGSGAYSISSPIVISAPGTYYLTRDIIQTNVNADAIQVAMPGQNVTIDLNGHTISTFASGQSPNPAANDYGVGIYGCANVTVRNGTISGFLFGVFSNNSYAIGDLVENIRFSSNTCVAVYLNGQDSLVRNCLVNQTGGSTLSSIADCDGIFLTGPNERVVNCDVNGVVHSANNGGNASGISFASATDGVILNNRVSATGLGLNFYGTCSVKYRDNLIGASVPTPVSGSSIDAGNNF